MNHPDTLPITPPTIRRHNDGSHTVHFGAGALHFPDADAAMTYHAHIVQLIGQTDLEAGQ